MSSKYKDPKKAIWWVVTILAIFMVILVVGPFVTAK